MISSRPRASWALLGFLAVWCGNAEALTPDERKDLLEKAAHWSVPQPAPDAGLIKVWAYSSESKDFYSLAFVDPKNPARVLVGFEHRQRNEYDKINPVPDPDKLSLDDITAASPFGEMFDVNFGLVTGIQLLRRGNDALGEALITKALATDSGHHRSPFRSPAGEPPVLMLARSCLAAALNEITSSKPDHARIKARIERLIADQPKLKTDATDWALKSLAENVAYRPAREGTVDRLIDDYLMSGGTEGTMMFSSGEFHPAKRALILKGFEAVPALLEARRSKRFSNHLMQGFNNFISFPLTADQAINAYLSRFANDEFGSNWLERQTGGTADTDAVLAWWKAASALGEQAYVKKHTIVPREEGRVRLSNELLLLAQVRYPALLPDFYRTLLATSHPSWPVLEAIVKTDAVPRDQKIELIEAAIAGNHENHRNTALGHLRDLNPTLADRHLVRLLKAAPATPPGEYWTDQDAGLGHLISKSTDPEVWRSLHALLDRADLGMRMELIANLNPPLDAPEATLRSFQEVYDRFQADETVRDESASEKFSGPGAASSYDRITMRDFIHFHWSHRLKLSLPQPKANASTEEWKTYREAVKAEVEKHRPKQPRNP